MKQTLQLKLGQQLTLTPQLQQAIRLLQLSTLELQQEVEQALEANPLLELQEEATSMPDGHGDGQEPETETALAMQAAEPSALSLSEADSPTQQAQSLSEMPVETLFEEFYAGGLGSDMDYAAEWQSPENQHVVGTNLHDQLEWQIRLAPLSERDKAIASAIIDGINEQGYLAIPLEDVQAALADPDIELAEIETVLHYIQHLDPIGVGARDLRECLLLQLQDRPRTTPWLREALLVVSKHMDLLSQHDFKALRQAGHLNEQALHGAMALIMSLNPRPGSQADNQKPNYIIPDVIVNKDHGRWLVELNPDITPHVRVNPYYAQMARHADRYDGGGQFVKAHMQEARWFIKSLQSRHDTLLKVASCIVERQRAFLEYGTEAMRPLVLHDVAETVGLHESTVSRVTTNKYILTPSGIYELKYFFSSHVGTQAGGECSSTAIRALIKKLIDAENHKRPLSDNKIADFLKEQGIIVARRTIAKYREAMAIPPSHDRKQLV